MNRGRWFAAAVGALALLALALRLQGLTRQALWYDEANGVLFALERPGRMLALLEKDSSPPLYYLLLHFWIRMAGFGETAVRLPSVFCGVLTAVGLALLGRRLYGPVAGAAAGVLAACAPLAVFQGQQARMYSLLPLLGLASVGGLALFLANAKPRWLCLSTAGTLLALYTHNYAFHLLPLLAALVLVSGQARSRAAYWLGALAALGLGYLPWLPSFLAQLGNRDHYAWFAPIWASWSPLQALAWSFASFSPGADASMYGSHDPGLWGRLPACAAGLLALYGLVLLLLRRVPGRDGRLAAAAAPLYALLPPLTALAASSLSTPHLVPGRVDQLHYPGFALLLAGGFAALRPRLLGALLLAGSCALSIITLDRIWIDPAGRPFGQAGRSMGAEREAAALIARRARPGDAVLAMGWSNRSLEYYLRLEGLDLPVLAYPGRGIPGLGSPESQWNEPWARPLLEQRAREVVAELHARLEPGGTLFFLENDAGYAPFLAAALAGNGRLAEGPRLGLFIQEGFGVPLVLRILGLGG